MQAARIKIQDTRKLYYLKREINTSWIMLSLALKNYERIVTRTRPREHTVRVLKSVHWLTTTSRRIDYKVPSLTFQCLHGTATSYLSES